MLGPVAVTSMAAYAYGTLGLRLSQRRLVTASAGVLDTLWFVCGFLLLNIGLAFVGVLLTRGLSVRGLSLHDVNDVSLVVFSLLQGLTFQLWRRESRLDAELGS